MVRHVTMELQVQLPSLLNSVLTVVPPAEQVRQLARVWMEASLEVTAILNSMPPQQQAGGGGCLMPDPPCDK